MPRPKPGSPGSPFGPGRPDLPGYPISPRAPIGPVRPCNDNLARYFKSAYRTNFLRTIDPLKPGGP